MTRVKPEPKQQQPPRISREDASTAALLKAVGEPTRLAVLRLLCCGPCSVSELNRTIPIDQSLLSHHLKTLRRSGLVVAERDGRTVRYRIAEPHLDASNPVDLDLGGVRLRLFPTDVTA